MIVRDPAAAGRTPHDLIVIGGGIYGVSLLLEAARRGLRPLLVERGDFGAATSWNGLGIAHGGLRYLQSLDLVRFRESVRERSWWLRTFPDLVEPLPCLMPLYGDGLRRPAILRGVLLANHWLSATRNRGLRAGRTLPRGGVLSVERTLELAPTLDRDGLRGGALWYDGVMPDAPRLLIEMVRWACACGAVALNYVEAEELQTEAGRVTGIVARDRTTGERHELRAPVVVNCAGPWSSGLARRLDSSAPPGRTLSLAFNILLDRPSPAEVALAVTPRERRARSYFVVPRPGASLAGTWHGPWSGGPRAEVDPATVREFLRGLGRALPGLDVEEGRIVRVYAGLQPAAGRMQDRPATRPSIRLHARWGGPRGLVSVEGVKYTTARRVAEQILRRIPGLRPGPPRPVARPPSPQQTSARELRELASSDRVRAIGLVRSIVRDESVCYREDVLLRRTDWGVGPDPSNVSAAVAELLDDAGLHAAAEPDGPEPA